MDTITVNYDNEPIYDIILADNFNRLESALNKLNVKNRKLCIVSDSNVSRLYLDTLKQICISCGKVTETFIFPAGEQSKNLDTVYSLYEHLIECNFDRKDMLIALGGGVVGDLTGYTAATYLRGIDFIQVPTSLLAMVDSSIGGKTGVDFKAYKNMVGAFHQPKLVYINLSTISSLNDNQFYSGLGEIIKHGLIKDKIYYNWLKESIKSIQSRDIQTLKRMIYDSCLIKAEVVERDPKELGERALLNFGHTIGHAVEKLLDFKLLHGECVSIGIVAASYISYRRDLISGQEFDQIIYLLKDFRLPTHIDNLDPKDILQVITHDKKIEAGKLKFILISQIGNAYIDTTVSTDEILDSIKYILGERQ